MPAWVIREVLGVTAFFHARVSDSVDWRGRQFKLQIGGTAAPEGNDGRGVPA